MNPLELTHLGFNRNAELKVCDADYMHGTDVDSVWISVDKSNQDVYLEFRGVSDYGNFTQPALLSHIKTVEQLRQLIDGLRGSRVINKIPTEYEFVLFATYIQQVVDEKGMLTYPELQSATQVWMETNKRLSK